MCSQLTTEQRPRLNERASEAVEDEGAAATATSVAVDEETLRVSAAPFPPPTFVFSGKTSSKISSQLFKPWAHGYGHHREDSHF